jgi:hypothetical protein
LASLDAVRRWNALQHLDSLHRAEDVGGHDLEETNGRNFGRGLVGVGPTPALTKEHIECPSPQLRMKRRQILPPGDVSLRDGTAPHHNPLRKYRSLTDAVVSPGGLRMETHRPAARPLCPAL